MKFKFLALVSVVLLSFGLSLSASAGSIDDSDTDYIPDVFDNCPDTANGPGDADNQTASAFGAGGFACDCDFTATTDGFVLGNDIIDLFAFFFTTDAEHDVTGDGFVLGDDAIKCIGVFFDRVGPTAI